uniref:BACK domain-containing protein n=1 Tax=Knipowitschia caucasica TaxID=637954 RepID=A0AAV2K7U7_KNICA
MGFIDDNTLDVKRETAEFEAIERWTNHDPQNRKNHFSRLLEKVCFSEISNEYVKINVLKNSLVGHIDFRKFVLSGLNTSSWLPGTILLAIGGWSGGNPTNVIEGFDWKANHWVNVTNHQEGPRAYHGAVFLDGSVYCVGGFNRLEQFNSITTEHG